MGDQKKVVWSNYKDYPNFSKYETSIFLEWWISSTRNGRRGGKNWKIVWSMNNFRKNYFFTDKVSPKVCTVLREEIENAHKQRMEKVERKVSIKLIGKDPSKKV